MGKTTKWSQEKYIAECKKVHGDKYDYSKVIYKNQQSKIIIGCKKHGYFEQWAQHHLRKRVGCPKCAGKINTDEFVKLSNIAHKNKYDYSETIYSKSNSNVVIICPIHGRFIQNPYYHLKGIGCPMCNGRNKKDKEIIKEFKNVHGDKYDYSKVHYTGPKNKLLIICPIHGEFKQLYNNHLRGCNCPKCVGKYKTTDSVIKEFKKIHGNKYDYSKVKYIRNNKKVIIICPTHGEFLQPPNSHLQGYGCRKCWGNYNMTTEEFIEKSKLIYRDEYDYSETDYKKCDKKVVIICKKHGRFEKTPEKHLHGLEGCPFCKRSKGESKIKSFLDNHYILYKSQKSFKDCRYKGILYFDFYLADFNTCIEFDGIQHYKPFDWLGGVEMLEYNKIRDEIKTNFCIKNDIYLIRIKYDDNIDEKLKCLINKNIN